MRVKVVGATFLLLFVFSDSSSAQDTCRYWQAQIDWAVKLPENAPAVDKISDRSVVKAIGCFLKMEGRQEPSRLQGATKLYVSQTFPPAPVEVAALYYISYLYKQKWDHADAIALVKPDEIYNFNPPEAVKQAYQNYRAWFNYVRRIGLAKARELKFEPLDGKGVRWY